MCCQAHKHTHTPTHTHTNTHTHTRVRTFIVCALFMLRIAFLLSEGRDVCKAKTKLFFAVTLSRIYNIVIWFCTKMSQYITDLLKLCTRYPYLFCRPLCIMPSLCTSLLPILHVCVWVVLKVYMLCVVPTQALQASVCITSSPHDCMSRLPTLHVCVCVYV